MDASYFNHPGVVITVSSGDDGYGVEYPASSPNVVAVGGTSLTVTSGPSGYTWGGETAWTGTGSGCSLYETKPMWQTDSAGCSKRTVVDVSADADPNTGAAVYATYGYSGWVQVGGTSLASPLIAAVYALSGNTSNGNAPYGAPAGSLHDVMTGSNGSCGGSYLCTAGGGYDGPTGLGTPNGLVGFGGSPPPPPSADYTLVVTPSTQTVTQGNPATYTAMITPNSAFVSAHSSVNVAVFNAPIGVTGCTLTVAQPSCPLTVVTNATTAPASYPMTFTGSGGGVPTHLANATLVIQAPVIEDFSLTISPTSKSLRTPGSTTYAVSIKRLNGFGPAPSPSPSRASQARSAPASRRIRLRVRARR